MDVEVPEEVDVEEKEESWWRGGGRGGRGGARGGNRGGRGGMKGGTKVTIESHK